MIMLKRKETITKELIVARKYVERVNDMISALREGDSKIIYEETLDDLNIVNVSVLKENGLTYQECKISHAEVGEKDYLPILSKKVIACRFLGDWFLTNDQAPCNYHLILTPAKKDARYSAKISFTGWKNVETDREFNEEKLVYIYTPDSVDDTAVYTELIDANDYLDEENMYGLLDGRCPKTLLDFICISNGWAYEEYEPDMEATFY